MTDFEQALVTYRCNEAACGFAATTQDEALEHKAETGHQWFHVTAGLPGAVGRGWAA